MSNDVHSPSTTAPDAVHRHLSVRLRQAGCVFAEDEARLLMHEAGSAATLDRWLLRRCAGEPLEVLLGWAEFWELRVAVAPGVFVPRRRTEALVRAALDVAPQQGVVVDLCTGTGAVARALAHERPDLDLYAADLHPAAVRCAQDNLAGHARVVTSDLFEQLPVDLRGRVDVVTANVPYVPTGDLDLLPVEARDHEPGSCHDGGADGLDLLRQVVQQARDWLAPEGEVLLELSRHQLAAGRFGVATAGLRPRVALVAEDGTAILGGTPR
jgi:release factor glutamine methyltransferase